MYKKVFILIFSLFLLSCSFLKENQECEYGVEKTNENIEKQEKIEEEIKDKKEEIKDKILNFDNIEKDSLIELFVLLLDGKNDYKNKILIKSFGIENVKKALEFYNYYIFNKLSKNSILGKSDYELIKCLDGFDYDIGNIDNQEDKNICLGKKGYDKYYQMNFYIEKETTKIYKQAYNKGGSVCNNILDFDYSIYPNEEKLNKGIYYIICEGLVNKVTGDDLNDRYLLFQNSIKYKICDYIKYDIDKNICEEIVEEQKDKIEKENQ